MKIADKLRIKEKAFSKFSDDIRDEAAASQKHPPPPIAKMI
jgi:hypothetical protein